MFSKILPILLVAVSFLLAANVTPSTSQRDQPSNVGEVINLHTTTAVSADTFDASENQTYGPYEVCPSSNSPMYKSFMIKADPITGTTPTMQIFYQMTAGLSITDTTNSWNLIDTLTTTGKSLFVDLSSRVGKGIMFRVYNYDGTQSEIPGKLMVIFKKDEAYYINK